MNIRKLISFALVLAGLTLSAFSFADAAGCIEENSVTRLNILQVRTCLLGDAAIQPNKQLQRPVVTRVLQTLKNVGDKTIELELDRDLLLRARMFIYDGDQDVSRRAVILPLEMSKSNRPPKNSEAHYDNEYLVLAPGEKTELIYVLRDFIEGEVKSGPQYTLAVRAAYPYRFMNEPQGKAFLLRLEEELKLKQLLGRVVFENIRLK